MQNLSSITDIHTVVNVQKPHKPTHIFRPKSIEKATKCFLNGFPGAVLYAVKTNPAPHVLQSLYNNGIRKFDVASLGEIELVNGLFPDANLFFMHTVKSRHAISEAYFKYGIRDFALDTEFELNKILEETKNAKDLRLYVRLAISNEFAELSLSGKFGVNLMEARNLLKKTRARAEKLGVCFHVGSQCMHPDAYRLALQVLQETIEEAAVKIDIIDVGGGFPSIYPGMKPLSMQMYFDTIIDEFSNIPNNENIELLCEPGRALVAESGSVIVRVELRRGDHLYINDGTYGSLFDAGSPGFVFPVRLFCLDGISDAYTTPFSFFGPTCDAIDYMKGPFYLPDDVEEGNYIEVGQLGAYGYTMSTQFNGFDVNKDVYFVSDEPLMSMYGDADDLLYPDPSEQLAA